MFRVLSGTAKEIEDGLNELLHDERRAFRADPEVIATTATRGGPHIGAPTVTAVVRVQDPRPEDPWTPPRPDRG